MELFADLKTPFSRTSEIKDLKPSWFIYIYIYKEKEDIHCKCIFGKEISMQHIIFLNVSLNIKTH